MPSPEASGSAVVRQVAAGAALMIAGRLVVRCLSLVSTLLLVRLLVPEDFGIVVLAGAALAVVEVLSVTNYRVMLVRQAVVDRTLYDTAWTLNLLRSLLMAGVVAATSEWQAELLNDARIGPILMAVSLTIVLDGLTSIGMVRLERELQYGLIFRFQVVHKLVAFVASIALAIAFQNYWCLVLGVLAARLVCVPYSYWLAPHRPKLSLHRAGELLRFSGWMLALNALAALELHGPNLVLGRWVGLPALGVFQVSYQIAATPVHEIAVPVRSPIYAGYAKVRQDAGLLRQHFIHGFAFICAVILPLSVGIALTAPQITRVALGPGWEEASLLIALCALYALFDCLAAFTTNIYFVLDALRRNVLIQTTLMLVRAPAVVAGAMYWGAPGVAGALVATAALNALVWHWQVSRLLGHRLSEVAAETWRSFAAGGVMVIAVVALLGVLPSDPPTLLQALLELLLLSACGAGAHIGTQMVLWRLSGSPAGAERRLLGVVSGIVGKLRRQSTAHPA